MKIICDKQDLLNGLQTVSRAVASKSPMPILECVLIEATGSDISLTANDLELGIMTYVTGNVEEEGSVAIDAKIILEIVRKMPDGEIKINCSGDYRVQVRCMGSNFTVSGKSGVDFCTLPAVDRSHCIKISQYSLKDIVRQTVFCLAVTDSNKMMTGELMEISEDGRTLKAMALDGHRVARRITSLTDSFDPIQVVIPGKTLQEVSRIIPGDTDKDVEIYFTDRHAMFIFEDTTVVTRLIEGEYFNIEHMFNNTPITTAKVNKKALLDSVDRSTLLIREGDRKPVIITVQDGYMNVSLQTAQGSMDEEIDIVRTGDDLQIGFNPKFLTDTLRAIDEEEITLEFGDYRSPCVIRNDEVGYSYLILPINIRNQ